MLQGHSSVFQALLGTFFTWGMTAAGAALVFVFSSGQRRILDGSLGFAAGVMLAASYWSLLAPAVEMATSSGGFGAFAFFPVAVGFTLGAAFVYLADLAMPHLGAAEDPQTALALNLDPALIKKSDAEGPRLLLPETELSIRIDRSENGEAYQRKKAAAADLPENPAAPLPSLGGLAVPGGSSWRRIALLILAITIHNIPEGLAVGVGFGAVEKTASATFESARSACYLDEWGRGGRGGRQAKLVREEAGLCHVFQTGYLAGSPPAHLSSDFVPRGTQSAGHLMRSRVASGVLGSQPGPRCGGPRSEKQGSRDVEEASTARLADGSRRHGITARTLDGEPHLDLLVALGWQLSVFPRVGPAVRECRVPDFACGTCLCSLSRYGQLSGMVEPLAGLFGAFAVVLAEPILPYALAFAAGAMVYVVVDDIIPEAQISGNGKLASWASILGFVVMMSLDVGLG
ncbi:zinc transporter ZIP11 [Pteropus alecto]|nr:zinc transporter ZIP11 [Pteropus alecto]